MSDYVVIFVTAENASKGEKIAKTLVQEKFAACVNMIPGAKSIYTWEGKLCETEEALLVIKSTKMMFPKIVATVRALHSYQVPEIIAVPVTRASEDYLSWLDQNVLRQ